MSGAKRLCLASPPETADTGQTLDCQQSIARAKDNPIVGLDVCGTVYYCRQATLVDASPYFVSFFRGGLLAASFAYKDPQERDVFFVERPPTTFKYIFEYIVSSSTLTLPDYQMNPTLIRNLRNEADFFGLEGLTQHLKVSTSLKLNPGNRGVLHWLGCRKGTAEYENPFTIGAVHVGGWLEDETYKDDQNLQWDFKKANPTHRRASFIHYQEPVKVERSTYSENRLYIDNTNCVLGGNHATYHLPVILDLKSVSLRPTHYSLRASGSSGMSCYWEFAGSVDGTNWDDLHCCNNVEERNKVNLVCYDPERRGGYNFLEMKLEQFAEEDATPQELSASVLQFLETDFRETWELAPTPTQFYRYFRIMGASTGEHSGISAYGEGLELFGDVHEE